ncbi:MAG: hypothetical protein H0U75_12145 [Legionella sp.]|nr:hypothetical protein [Legionella sp.]
MSKKPLESTKVEQLDILFNAWLASKNIISLEGTLYQCNVDGIIKEDKEGGLKVHPESFRALLEDPKEGYEAYLRAKGIPSINIRQHILPTERTQTQTVPDKVSEKPVTPAQTQDIKPTQPELPEGSETDSKQGPGTAG